ncbi:hypothetical protein LTR16_004146 [Cryomyces antarcticus]|uniref:F-box domain-containing protein n=1 Tax=Cryomyces antarcticus TaxID=329879 RepID=A0ABR0KS07_9PEZI|nr:hypothetical protein LTR16_004146 [Cryomyces antarcticus]
MEHTEAELESFRQQWREEVSARSKPKTAATRGPTTLRREHSARSTAQPPLAAEKLKQASDDVDEVELQSYHDLPDRELDLRLGSEGTGRRAGSMREPRSALEHYEQAVEKETQGSLGDSVNLYRKAFRLDDRVHETYKNKNFPPSSFRPKPADPNPSNAPVTVPNTAHHSLHGLPTSMSELLQEFSQLSIPSAPPPTELSPPPPCPIAGLPEEILVEILEQVAVIDIAAYARLAQVCKRFAYLVITEERIWKRITLGHEVGFAAMHYRYACDLEGSPHRNNIENKDSAEEGIDSDATAELPLTEFSTTTELLLRSVYASSWRQMFRSRPRLRFNGCYISTVNYTRPGAASPTQLTWNSPVHIVTYYRYLRFFRDGTVISLLTTTEPAEVVHHLIKENLHRHHSGALPSAVMKDALKGHWRLSGPGDGVVSKEAEGDVHIETEGVVPKYMWKMQFALGSAGRGTRNNKLVWKGFWSYNKLTDDWGEFGLKNDRGYYWSRVKSYGDGL